MAVPRDAKLLRIFLDESDHYDGKPLYSAIVTLARKKHLAGATVLRGPMGYGVSAHIHTASFLDIEQSLPVVVEIVDEEAKILDFAKEIGTMISSGLVTMEAVRVLQYGKSSLF